MPTIGIVTPKRIRSGTVSTMKKCGYVGLPEELDGFSISTIDPGSSRVASALYGKKIRPEIQSLVSQCVAEAEFFS